MKNTVGLIGYYGSDEIIAQSAWTSTSRDLSEEKRNRIPQLIAKLWQDGHHTPFEKGIVHFLVTSDIATHIHFLKHRMSSMNAESARYKELKEDKYYLPCDWQDIRTTVNPESSWLEMLDEYTRMGNELYHACLSDLTSVLGRKRAKESARYFKTYNSQITYDVMFNMRSFFNFQMLRNSEHAQVEIREIAEEMMTMVNNIENNPFKNTLEAFNIANYKH